MFSNEKGQCEASIQCGRQVAACFEDQKFPSLSPDQSNLANKMPFQGHGSGHRHHFQLALARHSPQWNPRE